MPTKRKAYARYLPLSSAQAGQKKKKIQPTNNTVPRSHKGASTKRMKGEVFLFLFFVLSRMRSTYGNTYIAPPRMTHADTTRMEEESTIP